MPLLKLNFILLLGAASAFASEPITRARYLMGTICEIHADGPEAAVTQAFEEIARIEKILSTWIPESEVSRLNRERSLPSASPELLEILNLSLQISKASAGAFDVTIKPLLDAWGIQGKGRTPTQGEIQKALSRTGWKHLRIQGRSVAFEKPGMALDFGAIGKGYALDKAALILKSHGIKEAMLNFGGQILVLGKRRVKVNDSDLDLKDQSVSVSSQEQRLHILDPRTGVPVLRQGAMAVISKNAAQADALSTAAFVLGKDKGAPLLKRFESSGIYSAKGEKQ